VTLLLALLERAVDPAVLQRTSAVLWHSQDEFEEISTFIEDAVARTGMQKMTLHGGFREGLEELRACGIRGIFMGQREGDPSAATEPFSVTSPGWPAIVRINPLLHWTYRQVWEYLDEHSVPYCPLYARGYTSLGQTTNTVPNPTLARGDGSFRHARELEREEDERAGRVKA
jgi:FAD synthetase